MATQDSDNKEPGGRVTPDLTVGLGCHMVESETEDVMLYVPAAGRAGLQHETVGEPVRRVLVRLYRPNQH